MLLHSQGDLILVLGLAAAILLFLALAGGIIAALKAFQVRQFQDLLFKAERKIDTLERRMFNVLNAVPVALVETDPSGKFTFANKAAHQLLGRKDSELIGLRFHSATWGITYPDGRMIPPDLMPIARTLRGQTVKGFQHMLTNHGSHDKFLVSVTSMPIMNRTGEITGASAAMVELETQAGQGIDDLVGLWRGQWFASATIPFWGLDAFGQILDVNNAALESFGQRREDALGKNWAQSFVIDADFRAAMDYLAEALDGEPHAHTSVTLVLKDRDGSERKSVVTAWMVRTHEGGDRGLTLMAMAAAGSDAVAIDAQPVHEAPATHASAALMGEDDLQELADLRIAESARAGLGVGVWQYDDAADAIIEDEGMQRLIGRDEPGGPTLISDDDQAIADVEFGKLLSGQSDALDLDIKVIHKDGSTHWINLKGQASMIDGHRHIFGVALDTTPWKQVAAASVDAGPAPIAAVIGISEADHEAALERARSESRDQALKQAEADKAIAIAEAIERTRAEIPQAPEIYAWQTPDMPEPVVVHQPDPQVLAENEALKTRLTDMQIELDRLHAAHGELGQQFDALKNAPAPEPQTIEKVVEKEVVVTQADPAVAAENAALKTQLQQAQADLERTRGDFERADTLRNELQLQLDEIFLSPQPVPDTSVHEARIDDLQAQLAAANDAKTQLQTALTGLSAKHGEIQTALAEANSRHGDLQNALEAARARHSDLEGALQGAGARHGDLAEALAAADAETQRLLSALDLAKSEKAALQSAYDELAAQPAPQPDYSDHEARINALQFELTKWQAAHSDVQARLEAAHQVIANTPPAPTLDLDALTSRLEQLQNTVNLSHDQQAQLQARLDQMNAALAHAQRFETIGRLTSDVAQDFAQMLGVINNALEVMSRTPNNVESVRRLSEAALAAGKRGERLTRQLQAFQSEDY